MASLETLAAQWAEAASADLGGLTGASIAFSGLSISDAALDRLLGRSGAIVLTCCTAQDETGDVLAFAAPLRSAALLAAARLGQPAEEVAGLAAAAFTGTPLEAWAELMELGAGLLGRVLSEEASLPGVTRGESHVLELPLSEQAPLAQGTYRRARFDLHVAGEAAGNLDLLLPAALVARWFGEQCRASAFAEGEVAPLVLIDASPEGRAALEGLEEELGRRVWALDPRELDAALLEEVAAGSAVVVCWDLGGLSGLEVLDRLRRLEAGCELPIAIGFEAPTRSAVAAALRWGARTALVKPWEAAEIQSRLLSPATS